MIPLAAIAAAGTLASGVTNYFGSKKAEAAARRAAEEAQARLDAESRVAEGAVNSGADTALGRLSPYAEQGAGASRLYSDALGVNGAPAQRSFYDGFQNDPGFDAELAAGNRQIEHSRIFGGRGNSGGTMQDLHAYGMRMQRGAFQDRLNRLAGLGRQGGEVAGTMGNIDMRRGQSLGDIAMRRGGAAMDTGRMLGQLQSQGTMQRANIIGDTLGGLSKAYGFGTGQIDGATMFGKSKVAA